MLVHRVPTPLMAQVALDTLRSCGKTGIIIRRAGKNLSARLISHGYGGVVRGNRLCLTTLFVAAKVPSRLCESRPK